MTPTIKNILAVFAGIAIGMIVNMSIVKIGSILIPLPQGVDPSDAESIANNINKYGPRHFIVPFFAHAFGTLAGAFTAVKMSTTKVLWFGLGIGAFFLIGGITMVILVDAAPLWFKISDLLLAYLPMGWLGWLFARNSMIE